MQREEGEGVRYPYTCIMRANEIYIEELWKPCVSKSGDINNKECINK